MKNIMLFEQFLNEWKSVGRLYHFTSVDGFIGMIEDDEMKSGMFPYISFTRNPRMGRQKGFDRRPIRIMLDGDLLSNRFKIEPFFYDPNKDPMFDARKGKISYAERMKDYGEEREERIVQPVIKGISRYIIRVDVRYSRDTIHNEELKKLMQDHPEIKFNWVDSLDAVNQNHH